MRYVYKNGKTIRGAKMSLIFTPNNKGFTRVGVVVSKKVDKRAVVRNRIRRRIYEVIRLNLEMVPKKMDYIFIVYAKEVERMKFQELEKMLGELVAETSRESNTRK